jgi:hypothetical protein
VLLAGFDAMVSDVDVVWLRPPWPLVRYSTEGPPVEAEAALLALADVILSVDQVRFSLSPLRAHTHMADPARTHGPLVRYSSEGPPVEAEATLLALADVILSVDQVRPPNP